MLDLVSGAEEISNFISNSAGLLTLAVTTYFLIGKSGKLVCYLSKYIFSSPGVGDVSFETRRKKKIGIVKTNVGTVKLPLVKMPCFDFNFGFFTENFLQDTGMMNLEKFNEKYSESMPEKYDLLNIGNFWIMNIRRPKDFIGRDMIQGYIESPLDDLIYLFEVKNNQIIDYEFFLEDYSTKLEEYEEKEKMTETNTPYNLLDFDQGNLNNTTLSGYCLETCDRLGFGYNREENNTTCAGEENNTTCAGEENNTTCDKSTNTEDGVFFSNQEDAICVTKEECENKSPKIKMKSI